MRSMYPRSLCHDHSLCMCVGVGVGVSVPTTQVRTEFYINMTASLSNGISDVLASASVK